MNYTKLEIPEIIVLKPKSFQDARGSFSEIYRESFLSEITGDKISFVQDNKSISFKNVIRGLHYQLSPDEQGKLISVSRGKIFDVAVDVRKKSLTLGKYVSKILSEENKEQIWIPPGFAHGFLALDDHTEITYKCTNYYSPNNERTINWSDDTININWPIIGNPIVSEKDNLAKNINEIELF